MTDQPTHALLKDLFEDTPNLPLGFEIFPPRTPAARAALRDTVMHLAAAAPDHFSVTMGAGGTIRTGTHETSVEVMRATGTPVIAHLTALGLSRAEIDETADAFWAEGIHGILALRGDAPQDPAAAARPVSYPHATGLVAALRARHDFHITVAAYPEKHPEAGTLEEDVDHLKEKLDAGASAAICQFVLNPEVYGRFLDLCAARGITAPIVPGVMPLDDWSRVRKFAVRTGATVPPWLDRFFAHMDAAPELAPLLGTAATLEHLRRLVAYGAPALHVYTLNRWAVPLALARAIGRPCDGLADLPRPAPPQAG
ncbi:methylenetetrahydrofolate reductase [Rhodovulum sp. YNF3179]|uniref:methylenetetrahydrofolate reductase n=1 Tax=Rhodovulum sp. YNF3179 TaxID=3425127 RepID=UPI003D34EFF9